MVDVGAVVGPTASGKSHVAVEAAAICRGEIISCDSVQVYRGMDIGSGKITEDEMQGIPHHQLDVAFPAEEYTAAHYQQDARKIISRLRKRGVFPILCGGTGLYLRAVLDDYDFSPEEANSYIKQKLRERMKKEGLSSLYTELEQVDKQAAQKIHPHDHVRILRALEVFYGTGRRISSRQQSRVKSIYHADIFGLDVDRKLLYERINSRVDRMIEKGLLEETQKLLSSGAPKDAKAMQTLGYKQMLQYLCGEISFNRAVELIKRDTRRYAKRQLTWFRNDPRVQWLPADTEKQLREAASIMGERWKKS